MKQWGIRCLFFGVGLLLGLSFVVGRPAVEISSPSHSAHLIIDFNDGNVELFHNLPVVTQTTVFDILKQAVRERQWPLEYDPPGATGVFIRRIGEKKNGDEKKYWQYWVNAEFPMVAADQYLLHGGETVLWKFAEEQP